MGFLAEILGRPENERPFILIPVGYPAPDAECRSSSRKPLDEILVSAWHLAAGGDVLRRLTPSSAACAAASRASGTRYGEQET